jgi:tetratricopeptide (TPR) repeat protein
VDFGRYGSRPVWQPLYRHDGELPNGLFLLDGEVRYTRRTMNTAPESSNSISRVSPSQVGSELLSRFVDIDALFSKQNTVQAASKPASIPLERFQHLEQEIRNSPANSEPYVELGQIYINQERWNDAKRVLDSGVQMCPECEPLVLMHEELMLHQANLLLSQAKTNLAQERSEEKKYALEQAEVNYANERIRICRERFSRHPEQKELLINWAIGLRQLGRFEEAIGLLAKAAEEPDLRARASLQLGMCYQTLNRPLEALASLRRASMFRSPSPEPKIRQRALELALDLAEEYSLIDSARFYAKQLLLDCDRAKQAELMERHRRLESMDL